MGPGGLPGLQNRVGGRKVAGGFDSLPPPPTLAETYGESRETSIRKSRAWLSVVAENDPTKSL